MDSATLDWKLLWCYLNTTLMLLDCYYLDATEKTVDKSTKTFRVWIILILFVYLFIFLSIFISIHFYSLLFISIHFYSFHKCCSSRSTPFHFISLSVDWESWNNNHFCVLKILFCFYFFISSILTSVKFPSYDQKIWIKKNRQKIRPNQT